MLTWPLALVGIACCTSMTIEVGLRCAVIAPQVTRTRISWAESNRNSAPYSETAESHMLRWRNCSATTARSRLVLCQPTLPSDQDVQEAIVPDFGYPDATHAQWSVPEMAYGSPVSGSCHKDEPHYVLGSLARPVEGQDSPHLQGHKRISHERHLSASASSAL